MVAIDREQAGEHHRLDIAVAGKRFFCAMFGECDGIADLHELRVLEPCDQVADLPHRQGLDRGVGRPAYSHFLDLGSRIGRHHANLHALADLTVYDAYERYDTSVGIEI